MTRKVTQQEINELLWRACDTFRGALDSSQYKDYILVMLFLKYVSDVWADKRAQFTEKYNGDALRVERAMARERFVVPPESEFSYLVENREAANLGELIDIALAKIEDANRTKLENVFRNISFNSEAQLGETKDRNRRLKNLLGDFSKGGLDMRPSHVGHMDVIGNAYEYLIGRFASDAGKKGGEFYTPPEVATLLAKLVAPQSGETIYDPACGSGSLLIKVAQEVGGNDFSLYGQEVNGQTWALCKMNMFLHEIDSARIEWGDTLNNPKHVSSENKIRKFDVVVANPPFSLDKWGAENAEADEYHRFFRGTPPKSKADYAFISHMVESAADDGGRVGVIVPHGVLFRGGAEGKIRQKLIEESLLETVVGLPANLFFGTGIPTAILLFRRGRTTSDVLFVDASQEFEAGKKQNRLRDADIEEVVSCVRSRVEVDRYARSVSLQEITENEFNLNISRYINTFEEQEAVDLNEVQADISALERELEATRSRLAAKLLQLGLVSDE